MLTAIKWEGGKKRPKDPKVCLGQTSYSDLDLCVCPQGSHKADVAQSDAAMLATCPREETKPQVSWRAIVWKKGLSQHQKNNSECSPYTPQWLAE